MLTQIIKFKDSVEDIYIFYESDLGENKMGIVVNLDVMLARRKMRLGELANAVGISLQNLSVIKTGKSKAIKFSTLDLICRALECQPGDILEYKFDPRFTDNMFMLEEAV